MENILAIDITRTSFQYAIISEDLDFIEQGKVNSDIHNKDELFGPIKTLFEQKKDQIAGISITMPGVIDRFHGIAYSGGVYSWVRNMEYAKELQEYLGTDKPIVLANDAKAAAMAEIGYGNLKHINNGAMVMIFNTGIGGTMVINGQIVDGHHYASGEISYMRGDYKGRDDWDDMFALACSLDGLSRCVEETSGKANLNLIRIFTKIQMGDEAVLKGVENYCDMLATYIYNIQCVCDCERIVLGGSITEEPLMLALIQKSINKKFDDDRYGNIYKPEMKGCCFHANARMYGAMYNWRDIMAHRKEETIK